MFHLGYRITYLRKKENLSQHVLASFLKKSRSFVAQLESGSIELSRQYGNALGEIFNVSSEYFQQKEHSLEVEGLLEDFFLALLMDEAKEMPNILSESYLLVSIEQEIAIRILEAAYHVKQRRSIETILLQKQFLNQFFDNYPFENFSPSIQKYYHLLAYQQSLYENQLKKSLEHLHKLAEVVQGDIYQGVIFLKKASISYQNQWLSQAFQEYNDAIKILEKEANPKLLARCYLMSSAISLRRKLYFEAGETLDKLTDLAKRYSLKYVFSAIYQHKGFISAERKDFEKALLYYKDALIAAEHLKVKIQVFISLIQTEIQLKNWQSAKNYIEEARTLPLKIYEEMIMNSYESQISLYEGRKREHATLLKKVLAYFESHGCKNELHYIYGYLAIHYAKAKSYHEATKYFMKKEELNDEND